MALNAYLRIKAQKQGEVKGGVTQKGREGSMEVIAYSHDIVSPRDAASGLPSGKRMHKPMSVTIETNKHDPILQSALVNNENLTEWKLDFYEPNVQGVEKNFYRIELTNANVCNMHGQMENNKHPDLMKFRIYCTWHFTYQKITWTYVDGGISCSDDWEAPVV